MQQSRELRYSTTVHLSRQTFLDIDLTTVENNSTIVLNVGTMSKSVDIRCKVEINPSYEWFGDAGNLGISHRELEVLALAMDGYTNKEVAEILHIKHQSVKNHMHRLFKKLGVKNGSQAVAIALSMNLIKWKAIGGDLIVEITGKDYLEKTKDLLNGKIRAKDISARDKRRLNAKLLSHGIDVDKLGEREKE